MLKKYVIGLLVLLTVMLQASYVLAGPSKLPPEPTIGTKSSDPNVARVDIVRAQSASVNSSTASGLIDMYGCQISAIGTSLVNVNGYTDTYSLCGTVKVTVYLQRWDGSGWVDITSTSKTAYNTDHVAGGKDAGASGAYYRARAVHYAADSGNSDTLASETSYIYVP